MNSNTKKINRIRRHRRTRAGVSGTKDRPRAAVFKSNKNISLQIIDDTNGKTLFSNNKAMKAKGKKSESAFAIGEMVGKRAVEKGIKEIVFDKGGYKYHGRVKAVADGMRKAGLKF